MTIDFLDPLERGVHEAASRLAQLARENEELRRRLAELEARAGEGGGEVSWRSEREEIRQRVARLVERLEALAGE